MSEIREELESIAKELNMTSDDDETIKEETSSVTETKKSDEDSEGADEYLSAPKSYQKEFAESFASLPQEWRKYLHIREQEVDKGFGELRERTGAYKHIDDIYAARSSELRNYGITSASDWLNKMAEIDHMLSSNPADTIKMLADVYKVNIGSTPNNSSTVVRPQQQLSSALADQVVQRQVEEFAHELDENGKQKHPFFGEVVKDIYDLLSKGMANNLQDAYDTAVWFNASTRDKLINERSQAALELKSKDAKKSKEASFAPKGRGEIDTKNLSLREELEMRFAALCDDE